MKKSFVCGAATVVVGIVAVAAGTARGDVAATSVTTNGTVLTIAVKGGETLNYDSRPLSIFTSIVKEGDGKAYFNHGVAITNAFTGTITVNAGILGATSIDNYGTPTVVTVAPGASLDLTSASGAPSDPRTMYNARSKLVMGGTGAAGCPGAVFCNAAGGGHDHMFTDFEMTADTTVGGSARWGMGGNSSGRFDMHGFTLTSQATTLLLDNYKTDNPGHINIVAGNVVLQNSGLRLYGGPANQIRLLGGTMGFWNTAADACPWTLVVAKGVANPNSSNLVTGNSAGQRTANIWAGPVLHTNGVMAVNANRTDMKAGVTFTGDFLMEDCEAHVGKNEPWLYFSGNSYIGFRGNTFTNKITHTSKSECMDIRCGMFEFTGRGPHYMSRVGTQCTNTWFHDFGYINAKVSSLSWFVERTHDTTAPATLIVTNGVLDRTSRQITMANSNRGNWGLLRVQKDAIVSNSLVLGWNGNGAAIVEGGKMVITGGSLANNASSTNAAGFNTAHGFLALRGGEIEATGAFNFGQYGRAVYRQTGGTFTSTVSTAFKPYLRGCSEIAVSGGLFRPSSQSYAATTDSAASVTPYHGFYSLDVSGAGVVDIPGYLNFQGTIPCTRVVSLRNGGTLKCQRLVHNSDAQDDPYPDTKLYIGFNGGVLKPTLGWVFHSNWNIYLPTAITVYNGGAIFDTGEAAPEGSFGSDCHFSSALFAPTGKSIKSITLPTAAAFLAEKYLTPPRIRITGVGVSATAIVEMDLKTLKPTGVTVTCPGFGYDDNTTVTVDSWNGETSWPCTFELEEQVGGGLVKRGEHGLILRRSGSTYAGDTTIEGGFIQSYVQDAIPSGRGLHLAGGRLLLSQGNTDFTLSVTNLTGYGSVENGTLTVTEAVETTAEDVLAGRALALTGRARVVFGAGCRLDVSGLAAALEAAEDVEELRKGKYPVVTFAQPLAAGAVLPDLPTDFPRGWGVNLSADRTRFVLSYARGTMVIFR